MGENYRTFFFIFSESEIMKALFRVFRISAHVTRHLLFHRFKVFQRVILIVFSCFVFMESAIVQKLSNISRLSSALRDNERVNLYHYHKVQTSLHYYRWEGERGAEKGQRDGRESEVRLIHVGRLDRGRLYVATSSNTSTRVSEYRRSR